MLNDFDLSANNGGWQWAASSGCDAQPYFRIFNPITQSQKFDADGKFIVSDEKMECCADKDAAKMVKVEVTNTNGKAKATVITSEKGNTNVQVFEGSLQEVKAKVEALK